MHNSSRVRATKSTVTNKLLAALSSTALLASGFSATPALAQRVEPQNPQVEVPGQAALSQLQVAINRIDSIQRPKLGDTLQFTLRVTSQNNRVITAFPRSSNLSNVMHQCRWIDLPANDAYNCEGVTHVVTAEDVKRGAFIPSVTFDITQDVDGEQVLLAGQPTQGTPIAINGDNIANPFAVVWSRTDTFGNNAKVGDLLTWTLVVRNDLSSKVVAYPKASNVDGALVNGDAASCRFIDLEPNQIYTCISLGHTVTAADMAAGFFLPTITLAATRDADGRDVISPGKETAGVPVPIGNRQPTPPSPAPGPGNPPTQPNSPRPPAQPVPPSRPVPPARPAPPSRPVPPAPRPAPPAQPAPPAAPRPNPGPTTNPSRTIKTLRLSGPSRVETAATLSRADFTAGAEVAILARADVHADSVSAVPLAKELKAPVLLTQSDALHPETLKELKRLQPKGGRVIIMGGHAAISKAAEDALVKQGFKVERLAGSNRAATAVATAKMLKKMGKAKQVLVTDGGDWQANLIAGTAAAEVEGVTLLTNGSVQAPETQAYMKELGNVKTTAIGAKAKTATKATNAYDATDPSTLSVDVAKAFFKNPKAAGIATTADFADALTGGAHIARKQGPIILVPSQTPANVISWIKGSGELRDLFVYGGATRISERQIADLTK